MRIFVYSTTYTLVGIGVSRFGHIIKPQHITTISKLIILLLLDKVIMNITLQFKIIIL